MNSTTIVSVATTNAEQLRAWDGDEGAYWAEHADRFDRAVTPHHHHLLAAAAITGAERVLDIGCGTGLTTRDAARAATDGTAVGVDLSSRMLEHARRRAAAEGLSNASFLHADAQIHPFETASFDLAISQTGASFFGDLDAAFTNIARAVRPGGRLALLTWRTLPENEWIREISGALAAGRDLPTPPPQAPGPFALGDPDRVRTVLGGAGFTDIELGAVDVPMWFGTDAADAHQFLLGLLGWMLEGADETTRVDALEGLRATLQDHTTTDGVTFGSAAWVITATRP
jgi:SAM-dependent methyltransferase